MANWDRVVTDRRLTIDLVEGHLAGLESGAYLFDQFHAVASGGSTGRRGIFAFGWREWAVGLRRLPADQRLGPGGHARAGRRPHADRHGRGQERHPHDQRDAPDLRQPGSRRRPVPGDPADRPARGRAQRLPTAGPHGLPLDAEPAGRRGPRRPAPDRAQADHHHQRAPAARGAPVAHRVVPRPRGQHVRDLRGRSDGSRLLARPRPPPLRRPGHHRAGRPGRPTRPARRPLRQGLCDRHRQPDPAADPPGGHRPGDLPGHALCLRLRPPADRRRRGPPRRPLRLPGRPGGPPARVRGPAPPRPGDRRVPGRPDPGRRRGPGRRGPGRPVGPRPVVALELARLGLPDPAVEVRVVDRLERQATGKVRRFRPLETAEVSRPA